ncbi:ribonuclease HI family protein [Candidatus Saccharibacteria bacterium]|nr:ribonuclease HI family protein [Candidatus Saccharibacteria bacterium]
MNDENAKILIALVLNSGNGVFLKRHKDGRLGLPSRFLEKDEQPEKAIEQLAQKFGMTKEDVAKAEHSFKNIYVEGKYANNIVVILTIYNLTGNNLSSSGLVEVNNKNINQAHLDKIAEGVLRPEKADEAVLENTNNADAEESSLNLDVANRDDAENEHKSVRVFSDGGSRGNPGHSACGFIIEDENGVEVYRGGEYLGITTNNQAEYHGVLLALEKALELGARDVDFRGDSLLVINQVNGLYKVKNRDLWPIYERIKELAAKFDKIKFTHVYREHNRGADAMVNEILDQHAENNK